MAGIEVKVDVGLVELLDRIHSHALVYIRRVRAALVAEVGNQVGEGVGLDDGHNADLGVLYGEL